MAKAKLKTAENDGSVEAFLAGVEDPEKRADCDALVALMRKVTRAEPRMWGGSIVGFGRYHYVYESGREGDWFLAGFSPRKHNLSLYVMSGFDGHEALLGKLGKFKTGKSCLYVKRLADVDRKALEQLLRASVKHVRATYG